MSTDLTEIELANGISASDLAEWLGEGAAAEICSFMRARYEQRYFRPIRVLVTQTENGYGFAIMSLCCLLIETLECYRIGMPTTSQTEWKRNDLERINNSAPDCYRVNFQSKRHEDTFTDFFGRSEVKHFFGEIDGKEFCRCIRNGLLHQAQTKEGWRIRRVGPLWNGSNRTLNRTDFAKALEGYFLSYVEKLARSSWDSEDFKMARRKLWWLIETSTSAAKAGSS